VARPRLSAGGKCGGMDAQRTGGIRHTRGANLRRRRPAAEVKVGIDQIVTVGEEELHDASPSAFLPAPQIAAAEATEDGRATRVGVFALRRAVALLHRVAHEPSHSFAWDRRINNCPVLVCDHHTERDGYFEIATVIDSPMLGTWQGLACRSRQIPSDAVGRRRSFRRPRPRDSGRSRCRSGRNRRPATALSG